MEIENINCLQLYIKAGSQYGPHTCVGYIVKITSRCDPNIQWTQSSILEPVRMHLVPVAMHLVPVAMHLVPVAMHLVPVANASCASCNHLVPVAMHWLLSTINSIFIY